MANDVPSLPILVTLMMEVLRPHETSVLTRTTQRNIPEDGIHHKTFQFFENNQLFGENVISIFRH
jgi:hypothetical protein